MGKPKTYQAPFDVDGNLMHYPHTRWRYNQETGERREVKPEWREVVPFPKTLKYKGYARGYSAAYFLWEDADGHVYPMFLTDLDTLLKHGYTNSVIMGLWIVCKRGQNYGIRLAEEKD